MTIPTSLLTAIASPATIGDPDGTRTVTSIIVLLIAAGLALVMVAVWLYRTTRPDPELLAPLEVMGERRWRRADPVAQRRLLDQMRPTGARPLTPSAAPPDLDEAFDAGPAAPGFDDLHRDEGPEAPSKPAMVQAMPSMVGDGAVTPKALTRPDLDDFGDDDIDPELLERARAEIEAELEGRSAGRDLGHE